MTDSTTSRRTTLRLLGGGLSAGLLGRLAGCLSPYGDVPASTPTIPTGVRVTDAHLQSAREQYERAERERQEALTATGETDLAAMPDWIGEGDAGAWTPETDDLPRWPTVTRYRSATLATSRETLYVRAWRGEITRSDAEDRVEGLSVPEYADVPTDRGDVAGGLVNAAVAQHRLHEAREAATHAGELVTEIPAETPEETVPEEFAGAVAVTLRNVVTARLITEDVRRLGTARPPGTDHADAFRRLADRSIPTGDRVADFGDSAVSWTDLVRYGDPPNAPDDLASLARWERAERGATATAALHGAQVRLLDGVAESVRTADRSVDGTPSRRRVGEAGKRAHTAVRKLLSDADPLTLALCRPVRVAFREATAHVDGQRGELLAGEAYARREAFLQFTLVTAVAERVPTVRRRLRDVLGG